MQLFLSLAIQHTLKIFFLRVTWVSFFLSQIPISVIMLLLIQQVPFLFFFFYYLHFTPITHIYPSIYPSIHPSPIHLSIIYFQRDMKHHHDSKSQSYIRRHAQRSAVPSHYPVPISPLFPSHSYPHPAIVNNFTSF